MRRLDQGESFIVTRHVVLLGPGVDLSGR